MKKKVVAKKKKRENLDAVVSQQVEVFKMATQARYEIAMRAYKAQDKTTQEALDIMVSRLRSLSTGQIRIFPEGRRGPSVVVPIEPALADQNILFLATEILKDLALFDVKVANYEFPTVYCAECGEKISISKAKRAKAKVKK